jgi:hypothetical protein
MHKYTNVQHVSKSEAVKKLRREEKKKRMIGNE